MVFYLSKIWRIFFLEILAAGSEESDLLEEK
jgi:hypothetical protein